MHSAHADYKARVSTGMTPAIAPAGLKLGLKHCLLALSFLLVIAPVAGQAGDDGSLRQFQWPNRLLLLFAPDRGNAGFQKMMQASQNYQKGFIERNLLRISVINGAESVTTHGAPAPANDHAGLPDPEQLYARYNIEKSGLAALLIGKDGTVKARWQKPVAIDTVFERIDTMPMRRREMDKRADKDRTDKDADKDEADSNGWFGILEL